MSHNGPDIFTVIKAEDHVILGKVLSISTEELIMQAVSDDDIPPGCDRYVDVFTRGHVFYRNVPAKLISVEKMVERESFSKIPVCRIKMRLHDDEMKGLLKQAKSYGLIIQ